MQISAKRPSRAHKSVPKARGGRILRVPVSRFFRDLAGHAPEPSRDAARTAELFRKMPVTFSCRPWWGSEVAALRKAVRDQFVRMRLRELQDARSRSRAGVGDTASLRAEQERIWAVVDGLDEAEPAARKLLPRVDWAEAAAACSSGRTPRECEKKWQADMDPAVNRKPWTPQEDARLQTLAVEHHACAWATIAAELGTARLPHACLARYQALNTPRGGVWTPEEDARLRELVAKYPLRDWQGIASEMPGKGRLACMNRWDQRLREGLKKGPWAPEEDEVLRAAVQEHGEDWGKAASRLPGRTNTACRERYVRRLRPGISRAPWTQAEVEALLQLVPQHTAASGRVSWVKVSKALEGALGVIKTDCQCRRRYNMFPGMRKKGKKKKKPQITQGGGIGDGAAAPPPAAAVAAEAAAVAAQAGDLETQIEMWMQGGVAGVGTRSAG